MDWKTCIAKIVEATAWPFALLVVVYWYFEPLRELLKRIKSAKWKEGEVQFDPQLSEAIAEVKKGLLTTKDVDMAETVIPLDQLKPISSRPMAQAWYSLEKATDRFLMKMDRASLPDNRFAELAELAEEGKFNKAFVSTIYNLRKVRNSFVRGLDMDVHRPTQEEEFSFVQVCGIIERALDRETDRARLPPP